MPSADWYWKRQYKAADEAKICDDRPPLTRPKSSMSPWPPRSSLNTFPENCEADRHRRHFPMKQNGRVPHRVSGHTRP